MLYDIRPEIRQVISTVPEPHQPEHYTTTVYFLICSCQPLYVVFVTRWQTEIESINGWLKTNFLVLNVEKTKELVMGSSKWVETFKPVVLDQTEIETVDKFKYLGTVIDCNLNFQGHSHMTHKKSSAAPVSAQKTEKFQRQPKRPGTSVQRTH